LALTPGTTYYVTVEGTNGVGLTSTASSNGVRVDSTPACRGDARRRLSGDATTPALDDDSLRQLVGFSDPESGDRRLPVGDRDDAGRQRGAGLRLGGQRRLRRDAAGARAHQRGDLLRDAAGLQQRRGLHRRAVETGCRWSCPNFSLRLSGRPVRRRKGRPTTCASRCSTGSGRRRRATTGTIALSSSDPAAQLPGPVTFVGGDAGDKTLAQQVLFWTLGTQRLDAVDQANPALGGSLTGIVVEAAVAPRIIHDANLHAATGVPYRYNALGRVEAVGTRPLGFAVCDGPAGLTVEALNRDGALAAAGRGERPASASRRRTAPGWRK